jgi:hypothetical protein
MQEILKEYQMFTISYTLYLLRLLNIFINASESP